MEESKSVVAEQTSPQNISIISLRTYIPNAGKFVSCHSADESFALQIAESTPTLFCLSKQPGNDKKKVVAVIKMHVIDCVKYFKVAKPLTENEIDKIAESVFADYCYYFTFTDVSLVLNRAVTNSDTLYNKLEVRDVMKWFKEYDKEKTEAIQTYRENEKNKKIIVSDANTKAEIDKETQRILRTYQKLKNGDAEPKPNPDVERAKRIKEYAETNGAEYKEWREKQIIQQILSKPINERTENEQRMVARYDTRDIDKG